MRHNRMLAPINTVKHIVQRPLTAVVTGTVTVSDVAVAVVNTALPVNTNDVTEGAVLKAVMLEYWLKGLGTGDGFTQFNFLVYKDPGGSNPMSYTDTLNIMAYDNKKNIFFTSQGVIGGVGGGQAIPVIRQWIKIPKSKQRFGVKDKLSVAVSATGQNIELCGVSIYKEYR